MLKRKMIHRVMDIQSGFKNQIMKKSYLSMLIILMLSCGEQDPKSDKTERKVVMPVWLAGTWQVSGSEQLFERWEVRSDSLLTGNGFHVEGQDTTFFEFLKIRQFKDSLCYIATVTGQNNGNPVFFRFSQHSDSAFICENQKHDYPQRIEYRRINRNNTQAIISGITGGEEKKFEISFIRKE